jgi:hypothetical protein
MPCNARIRFRKHPNGWGFTCAFHGSYTGRYATKARAKRAAQLPRYTCDQRR